MPAADNTDREIIITRTVAAPPARVWQAWSDPDALAQWFGPDGFTTTTHHFDLRPGGMWRFTMHGPPRKCSQWRNPRLPQSHHLPGSGCAQAPRLHPGR